MCSIYLYILSCSYLGNKINYTSTMVKNNNDSFLSALDKMFSSCKQKGSVTITLKRCKLIIFNIEIYPNILLSAIKPENGKYKPGTKQKREAIQQEKRKNLVDPNQKYPLILHAKTDDAKVSTEVRILA